MKERLVEIIGSY